MEQHCTSKTEMAQGDGADLSSCAGAGARPASANLNRAQARQDDEFYTPRAVVEAELAHYRQMFQGLHVYCNCDDSETSEFARYFLHGFDALRLASLTTTCYRGGRSDLFGARAPQRGQKLMLARAKDGNADYKEAGAQTTALQGDGDFRSGECAALLRQCDVVATNPPFSLIKEFIPMLLRHNKKFLILAPFGCIAYNEIFPYFKDGKIWLGHSKRGMAFHTPDGGMKDVNACWLTNLGEPKIAAPLHLTHSYSRAAYPKYDNYDAIEVGKAHLIPKDYDGIMGVPITFLDKWDRRQFDLVGSDRALPGGGSAGRFKLNGKEKFARILIRRRQF